MIVSIHHILSSLGELIVVFGSHNSIRLITHKRHTTKGELDLKYLSRIVSLLAVF